jgi:hypothetical protein
MYFVCSELGSADDAKKKARGNDVYSENSAQGFKVDNKEQSLLNNCESFDSKNEDSKGGVFASKKPKLHWGYSSNSTLNEKKKKVVFYTLFGINLDLLLS